jgi:KaiC/GvpD/RAD55 family RecA-like ATPase
MAAGVLKAGNVVNVITLATPPSQIRSELKRGVPNLSELETGKRFFLADWHTWMTGKKSEEAVSMESLSLAKMSLDQSRFQRQLSPAYDFVVADSASTILKYNDERAFMQWFDRIVADVKLLKGIRLYGFLKKFHSESLYTNIESIADGVVELDYRERNGLLENVFRLKTVKGMAHSTEWRKLSIAQNGGLVLSTEH